MNDNESMLFYLKQVIYLFYNTIVLIFIPHGYSLTKKFDCQKCVKYIYSVLKVTYFCTRFNRFQYTHTTHFGTLKHSITTDLTFVSTHYAPKLSAKNINSTNSSSTNEFICK